MSNVQGFRGGLVFKTRRLLYHSTKGLRVTRKEEEEEEQECETDSGRGRHVSGSGFIPSTKWSARVSLARNSERHVTKFAPRTALKLIA